MYVLLLVREKTFTFLVRERGKMGFPKPIKLWYARKFYIDQDPIYSPCV